MDEQEGYLTDESSFYGDDEVKASLETKINTKDLSQIWSQKESQPSITAQADINMIKNMAIEKQKKAAVLFNPYEGHPYGKQLGESIETFVKRLPPATTPQTSTNPWIWVANPFMSPKDHHDEDGERMIHRDTVSYFSLLGKNVLSELEDDVAEIAKSHAGQPQLKVTRLQNKRRDEAVTKLKEIAIENGITSGKWMLFASTADVNEVWTVVARAVSRGDLGTAAKVAPDAGHDRRESRLICVYTKDFTDVVEIKRVCARLKELGCFSWRVPIYYKPDLFTYLDINSGNRWGITPRLYTSSEILAGKQQKMEGFLKKA